MGEGQVVVCYSLDEEIDVKFWKTPRLDICFRAVHDEIPFEVTAELIDDFVADQGLEVS